VFIYTIRQNDRRKPQDAQRLRDLRPHDTAVRAVRSWTWREIRVAGRHGTHARDIRKTLAKFPNDMRVEERAVNLVNNIIRYCYG